MVPMAMAEGLTGGRSEVRGLVSWSRLLRDRTCGEGHDRAFGSGRKGVEEDTYSEEWPLWWCWMGDGLDRVRWEVGR